MTVDEGRRRRSGGRRARLDPETRRTQLVDAAVGLVDERGLAALGVDDVADAAGVSRSLVYAYFGDRDGLAAEVYVRMLARLDEYLDITLPLDEDAVRKVVAGCMAFAEANPEAWRLLVSDPARQHPVVRQARADRAARVSGRKLAGGPLAAEAALGLLEAGVLHWLDHPEIPAEQAAGLLTSILWSGLAARPAPPADAVS